MSLHQIVQSSREALARRHQRQTLEELQAAEKKTGDESQDNPTDATVGDTPADGNPGEGTSQPADPIGGGDPSPSDDPDNNDDKVVLLAPSELNVERVTQAVQDIKEQADKNGNEDLALASIPQEQREIELTNLNESADDLSAVAESLFVGESLNSEYLDYNTGLMVSRLVQNNLRRCKLAQSKRPVVEDLNSMVRRVNTRVAVRESIVDAIKQIWQAICDAVRRAWDWLTGLVRQLFNGAERQVAATKAVITEIVEHRKRWLNDQTRPTDRLQYMKAPDVFDSLSINGQMPACDELVLEMDRVYNMVRLHRNIIKIFDEKLVSSFFDSFDDAIKQNLTVVGNQGPMLNPVKPIDFKLPYFILCENDDEVSRVEKSVNLQRFDMATLQGVGHGLQIYATTRKVEEFEAEAGSEWVTTERLLGNTYVAYKVPTTAHANYFKSSTRSSVYTPTEIIGQVAVWDVKVLSSARGVVQDGWTPWIESDDLQKVTAASLRILDEVAQVEKESGALSKVKDLMLKHIKFVEIAVTDAVAATPANSKMYTDMGKQVSGALTGIHRAISGHVLGVTKWGQHTSSAWSMYLSALKRHEAGKTSS